MCGRESGDLPRGIVVYLAPIPWDYLWQRPQQLMSRLAASLPVLYVQPEPLRNPTLADLVRGLRRVRLHLRAQGARPRPAGLRVVAPPFIPVAGSRLGDRINAALMARAIPRRLGGQGPLPTPVILWCTRPAPAALRLARAGRHTRLVYERMDAIPGTHARARRLSDVEGALLREADLVLCTAAALADSARRLNARTHLVPNAVDPRHFRPAIPGAGGRAGPLGPIMGPIVGYCGTIAEWLDFPLLAALADRFPDVQFVMVGPIEVPRTRLPRRGNLHWLGPRSYEDLPAYLAGFAVCLLPFRVDEFTRAVNPVKLFEYFATGKPVVSTPLPEVTAFGELVYVGEGRGGVASAVEAALAEGDQPALATRRRAVADTNTWDDRVARILHLLHPLL